MTPISLPVGVRFHPTDEELLVHYLKKKVLGENIEFQVIRELQIYDYAPNVLPEQAYLNTGDLEWYFFCHLNRKHPNGRRTSRATPTGFWKTTGEDRKIFYESKCVGKKKTLVFYDGKTKGGSKTDWFIYEYRFEDPCWSYAAICQDKFVICKLFKKNGSGPGIDAPFKDEPGDRQPPRTDIVEPASSESSNVDPPIQQPKLPTNSIPSNLQFSPPFDNGKQDDYLNLQFNPPFDYGIPNEYIVELAPSESCNVDPPIQQPNLPTNSILSNLQFSPPFDNGEQDDDLNLQFNPPFDFGIPNEYTTTEDCTSDIHRACPPNAWEEMIDYPDSQSFFGSIESQYPAPSQQYNSLPSGSSDFELEKMLMSFSEPSANYPGTYADTNIWFPDGVKRRKLCGTALQKFQIDQLGFPDGNTQQQLHHVKHMP